MSEVVKCDSCQIRHDRSGRWSVWKTDSPESGVAVSERPPWIEANPHSDVTQVHIVLIIDENGHLAVLGKLNDGAASERSSESTHGPTCHSPKPWAGATWSRRNRGGIQSRCPSGSTKRSAGSCRLGERSRRLPIRARSWWWACCSGLWSVLWAPGRSSIHPPCVEWVDTSDPPQDGGAEWRG